MKWVLSHQSSVHHRWQLRDAAEPALFTYRLQHASVRIQAKTARLFFLEFVAGFFQKKVLLRSEYGIAVGEAQLVPTGKTASLTLDDHTYFYCWQDRELFLYHRDKTLLQQIRVECRQDTATLEQFAFVFNSVWLAQTQSESKHSESFLMA